VLEKLRLDGADPSREGAELAKKAMCSQTIYLMIDRIPRKSACRTSHMSCTRLITLVWRSSRDTALLSSTNVELLRMASIVCDCGVDLFVVSFRARAWYRIRAIERNKVVLIVSPNR